MVLPVRTSQHHFPQVSPHLHTFQIRGEQLLLPSLIVQRRMTAGEGGGSRGYFGAFVLGAGAIKTNAMQRHRLSWEESHASNNKGLLAVFISDVWKTHTWYFLLRLMLTLMFSVSSPRGRLCFWLLYFFSLLMLEDFQTNTIKRPPWRTGNRGATLDGSF